MNKSIDFSAFTFLLLFCCCFIVPSLPAQAMEENRTPVFIEALGDVPLMQGLDMQEESLVLFDKAQGRYAEIAASAAEGVSQQDILDFYASALPALGWRNMGVRSYKRGQETLKIELKNVESLVVVRFIVSPAKN